MSDNAMCGCGKCRELRKWKQREDEMLMLADLARISSGTLCIKKPEIFITDSLKQQITDLRRENHALSSSVEAAWVEYRKMRDENDTFRNKLASSEATFRSVNNQNADLRESLTQQAAEFENLMAAYKALLESQKHLIGALE